MNRSELKMASFNVNDALSFVKIVEEGGFLAAAKKMRISSSVLSKRLTRLEEQLHVQLLQRTTRTLVLTETGQIFYERCKRIKSEIKEAVSDILQHRSTPSGLLRVNAPMSFGQVHLVPAINEFLHEYPEIRIELILGSQYASFIHNGLDLAIFIKDLPETLLLKSRKITVRSTGIYGSPQYFEKFPKPMHPEELSQHNCLVYQSEPGDAITPGQKHKWLFHEGKDSFNVAVSGNLAINSSQALVKAAIAGIGLVKLSSFLVTSELKNGSLLSVLRQYCPSDIDIHAAYPNQRYVPSKVKLFIDFLIERFNKDNYWHKKNE
jgi:DNA-binding transcriptional LysR family regulator